MLTRVLYGRHAAIRYGLHGVCHQLANQVLYATGTAGAPLTVAKARGYWWSVFQYGEYGVPEELWVKQRESCSAQRARPPKGEEMARVPDEFEMRARAVLEHESPELLTAFLALRAEAQRKAVEEWPKSGSPSPALSFLMQSNSHVLPVQRSSRIEP